MDDLARLVAIEEIRQLKARYFRHMDMRDFDAMTQVFCRDAIFDCSDGSRIQDADGAWKGEAGPVTHGRDAIMAWIRQAFADRTSAHHGHCHEVTIESATQARGIVAMQDHIRSRDRETRIMEAMGYYHERYRVEDGAWRIAETRLIRLFRG